MFYELPRSERHTPLIKTSWGLMTGTGLVTSDQSATLWYWIACMVLGMVKVGSNALGMIACVVVIDILVAAFDFLPLLKVNRIKKVIKKRYGVNSKKAEPISKCLATCIYKVCQGGKHITCLIRHQLRTPLIRRSSSQATSGSIGVAPPSQWSLQDRHWGNVARSHDAT